MYNNFNSPFFHTMDWNLKLLSTLCVKWLLEITLLNFFMNSGIAREKTGALGSSLSVFGPIRLFIQHLPLILWVMGMAENQSIGFCYEQRA